MDRRPVLSEPLDPLSGVSKEGVKLADAIKCSPPDGVDNLQRDEAFAHCLPHLQDGNFE